MSTATVVVTVLMCLVFLAASLMKLTGRPQSLAIRDRLSVTPERWRLIGVLELAGVAGALIGLAVPPLGIVATGGLVLTSIGATASHLRVRDSLTDAAAAVIALVVSVAALVLQVTT